MFLTELIVSSPIISRSNLQAGETECRCKRVLVLVEIEEQSLVHLFGWSVQFHQVYLQNGENWENIMKRMKFDHMK